MLTSKQRAFLRSKANGIDTIFQIGKEGIGDNLVAQVNDALRAREIIKLRVLETAMLTTREACDSLCAATNAEGVQCIGTRFVIYKANPQKPVIVFEK